MHEINNIKNKVQYNFYLKDCDNRLILHISQYVYYINKLNYKPHSIDEQAV